MNSSHSPKVHTTSQHDYRHVQNMISVFQSLWFHWINGF